MCLCLGSLPHRAHAGDTKVKLRESCEVALLSFAHMSSVPTSMVFDVLVEELVTSLDSTTPLGILGRLRVVRCVGPWEFVCKGRGEGGEAEAPGSNINNELVGFCNFLSQRVHVFPFVGQGAGANMWRLAAVSGGPRRRKCQGCVQVCHLSLGAPR